MTSNKRNHQERQTSLQYPSPSFAEKRQMAKLNLQIDTGRQHIGIMVAKHRLLRVFHVADTFWNLSSQKMCELYLVNLVIDSN